MTEEKALSTELSPEENEFKLAQRRAQLLSSSSLVPKEYQGGKAPAIANCMIAEQVAKQVGIQTLTVMQNLHVIQGKPSWSSTYIISALNSSGNFSPVRFDIEDLGEKKNVEYTETEWISGQKQTKTKKIDIHDIKCTAYAIEKATGERLDGPPVSIVTAVKEGWYTKSGSKWPTMPELMLRYRAAAFFGRLYAPEILNGMHTVDENQDLPPEPVDITAAVDAEKGSSSNDIMTAIDIMTAMENKAETTMTRTGSHKTGKAPF